MEWTVGGVGMRGRWKGVPTNEACETRVLARLFAYTTPSGWVNFVRHYFCCDCMVGIVGAGLKVQVCFPGWTDQQVKDYEEARSDE